jgi:inorganic pyrophosphatase/exopolyphosphatase
VYDHHVGFEEYWQNRIGEGANIEFIGAAATLVYREWKKSGLEDKMSRSSALLLIAAILDNTLNLTSSNTTIEDIETFKMLCIKENIDEEWCASYFAEVQTSVEANLRNALFNDIKNIRNNKVLPSRMAQLCVWNASSILSKLTEIRMLFADDPNNWVINIIDIKHRCSYFVCDSEYHQRKIEKIFDVSFKDNVAKSSISYLRKQIIKKTL